MTFDESWMYPGTIAVLLILAFMQWQINARKTMWMVLVVLAYIIYSHETGQHLGSVSDGAVDWFNDFVR